MSFLAVVSSPLPPFDVVYPVFFLNSATNKFNFRSGVTPGGCHPGRWDRPLPFHPSDATVFSYIVCLVRDGCDHGCTQAWAMGKVGAHLPHPRSLPHRKCRKMIFVLQVLSKVSVVEAFMHYLTKCRQLLGALPQTPTGVLPLDPAVGLSFVQLIYI